MTDIRRYKRSTVESAASGIDADCAAGEISEVEYALELHNFRVRDLDGAYWFHNPKPQGWFRFDAKNWRASDQIPNVFEAPNVVALWGAEENVELGPSSLDDPPPQHAKSTEAMSAIVDELHVGFEKGTLSSAQAELMLAQQFLIDLEGGFWTEGFRSRNWYCFQDEKWKQMASPPNEDQLFHLVAGQHKCGKCGKIIEQANGSGELKKCPHCHSDSVYSMANPPEKIGDALPSFLLLGLTALPEAVADEWNPPRSFPSEVVNTREPCPTCRAMIPINSRFCNQCGVAFDCPSCGFHNPPGNKCCSECGSSLTREFRASKPLASPPVKTPLPLICSQCGAGVEPSKKFCTRCGTRISKE